MRNWIDNPPLSVDEFADRFDAAEVSADFLAAIVFEMCGVRYYMDETADMRRFKLGDYHAGKNVFYHVDTHRLHYVASMMLGITMERGWIEAMIDD